MKINKKWSRIIALVAVVSVAMVLPLHTFAQTGTGQAAAYTEGEAAMMIAALGVATMFGCVACGAIALGMAFSAGMLQWLTADNYEVQAYRLS
jgi:hypothetical protein